MKKKELKNLSELKFTKEDKQNGIVVEFIKKNSSFYCTVFTRSHFEFTMQLQDLECELDTFSLLCNYEDVKKAIEKTKAKNTITWLYKNEGLFIEERDKENSLTASQSLKAMTHYYGWVYEKPEISLSNSQFTPCPDDVLEGLQAICGLTIPSTTYEDLAKIHVIPKEDSLLFLTTQGISILGVSLRNPTLSQTLSNEYTIESTYFANLFPFLSSTYISLSQQDSIWYLCFQSEHQHYQMRFPLILSDDLQFQSLNSLTQWNLEKIQNKSCLFSWDLIKQVKIIDKYNQSEKKKLEEMVDEDSEVVSLPKGAKAYLSLLKKFWCIAHVDLSAQTMTLQNKVSSIPCNIKFTSPISSTYKFDIPYQDLRCIVEQTGEEDTWGYCKDKYWNTLWCKNRFALFATSKS